MWNGNFRFWIFDFGIWKSQVGEVGYWLLGGKGGRRGGTPNVEHSMSNVQGERVRFGMGSWGVENAERCRWGAFQAPNENRFFRRVFGWLRVTP